MKNNGPAWLDAVSGERLESRILSPAIDHTILNLRDKDRYQYEWWFDWVKDPDPETFWERRPIKKEIE